MLLLWFLLVCFLSLYGRLGISHYSGSRLRCFRCRCFNRFSFLPDLGNRCGWLLLLVFGLKHPVGIFLNDVGIRFVMTWYGGVLASAVVAFPLMYRTARGAFESFDETLAWSSKTLGLSDTFIFWHIRMPYCKQGIIAGTVLAFARALGEYGATSMLIGYIPKNTATISTTVYQLWRTNDEYSAFIWVLVNIAISAVVLLTVNLFEKRSRERRRLA